MSVGFRYGHRKQCRLSATSEPLCDAVVKIEVNMK